MQTAANTAAKNLAEQQAKTGYFLKDNNGNNLPVFTDGLWSSDNTKSGLKFARDPRNPDKPLLWSGASSPVPTAGKNDPNDITITQNSQQAYLQWDKFNIGKNTTLNFDQGNVAGAAANTCIAFNYIRDPSAQPSQILGTINAQGQVYILNANGILFGGTAVVNTHALVASSLPISPILLQRGLLVQEKGDVQLVFSGVKTDAGFNPNEATLAGDGVAPAPVQTAYYNGDDPQKIGLTGFEYKYGDVTVQPGAVLTAKDDEGNHIGGRIALIGANVTNAGTILTNDGQTILAAGLQVGLVPHNSADPTLRGLDVFVGKVIDDSLPLPDQVAYAGTAENSGTVGPNGLLIGGGLIEAKRGNIYITGRTVNQNGAVDSSTSVSYNGRIDLVAGYNAVANPDYNPSSSNNLFQFLFQSSSDNSTTGLPVLNSGAVTLGAGSVLRILPEAENTERATGDLALPSQVNIQGNSVYFEQGSILIAPGAAAPPSSWVFDAYGAATMKAHPAYGADGIAFDAGVTIRAGGWYSIKDSPSEFVNTLNSQQIYLASGAAINVAGLTSADASEILSEKGVPFSIATLPSVTENIISVELTGSELAGSPLQRNGALYRQQIMVDVRQHGAWDPSLNGGAGGYTWIGTPLADASGWVGFATHTVAELSTNGGSVALKAGGAMILQAGAQIDVSGGSVTYQGGYVQTTKLLSAGHLIDISKATPDRVYDGIYSDTTTTIDPRWGVTTTTVNPLRTRTYEAGYTQGGNGGSLSISAPVLALDGALRGNTEASQFQRTLSPVYNPNDATTYDPANPRAMGGLGWLVGSLNLPVPSQLRITVGRQLSVAIDTTNVHYLNYSPTPANIVFTGKSSLGTTSTSTFDEAGNYSFPTDRNYELDFAPALFGNDSGAGFGILRLDNSGDNFGAALIAPMGNIKIASGTTLDLSAGGSLSLSAANIIIENNARVEAPGGSISINAYELSSSTVKKMSETAQAAITVPTPQYDPLRGRIVIGGETANAPGAAVSVAGLIAYDRSSGPSTAQVTKAGTVSFNGSDITLAPGSIVDVSGGAAVSALGKFTYADAGNLNINSGLAIGDGIGSVVAGSLKLGATLKGYAGVGKIGGTLAIQAAGISIRDSVINASTDPVNGTLLLAPKFFSDGGFSSFTLTGLGVKIDSTGAWVGSNSAFVLAENTTPVAPRVKNWVALPGGEVFTADAGLRTPAKIKFSARGQLKDANNIPRVDAKGVPLNDTSLVLGEGSSIITDAGPGSVTLSAGSKGTIDVLGRITAPGGYIEVSQTNDGNSLPTIHLGKHSSLDTSGAVVYTTDSGVYHKANVIDGGTILVDGNIVAEEGAGLDVSGYSDTISLMAGNSLDAGLRTTNSLLTPVVKDSNGGTITLKAEQMLFTAATLRGAPGKENDGSTTSQAGNLIVISNLIDSKSKVSISIADDTPVLAVSSLSPKFTYINFGSAVRDGTGNDIGTPSGVGRIFFGVDRFKEGGFGALTLSVGELGQGSGAVQVNGNVELKAARQLSVADGGLLTFMADDLSSGHLSLNAPYVVLGQPFQPPSQTHIPPAIPSASDPGDLTVTASSLIDVGNLALKGTLFLDATNGGQTNGSIRGNGTLAVDGLIKLQAGQIYPPTAASFNIIATESVKILPAGVGTSPDKMLLPLSAGGTLAIAAPEIDQGGVLRAPLGKIILGGSGTVTLNLTPNSITSVSAVDSNSSSGLTIPYGIVVNGDTWIDPKGNDITSNGSGSKSVTLAATDKIDFAANASVDLQGGGDLYAYQFVPGTGGTKDILLPGSTVGSFAIIPTYSDSYAPYAPNVNSGDLATALGKDPGYVYYNDPKAGPVSSINNNRIFLAGGGGLAADYYTLLPARYALLPGAYLVTPQGAAVISGTGLSVTHPDGSALVSGYRFNGFDNAGQKQTLFQSFEIASLDVVKKRAQYGDFYAKTFFTEAAKSKGTVTPRIPVDAGQLVLLAGSNLSLQGRVAASAWSGGRGAMIDISSTASGGIRIGGTAQADELWLDPGQLNGFGAESLLIGGTRSTGNAPTTITATATNLTVDNAGVPLVGTDTILTSANIITVKAGAAIGASPASSATFTAEPLQIVGDGTLVRVSSDENASFVRTHKMDASGSPLAFGNGAQLSIYENASITGNSIILDSSASTQFSPGVTIGGPSSHVALSSGQISIDFLPAGATRTGPVPTGLVLGGTTRDALNRSASLSLLSYGSIDFYGGNGTLSGFDSLAFHAAALRNVSGGSVTIAAKNNILLDNIGGAIAQTLTGTTGTLELDADTIRLGSNQVVTNNFSTVTLAANGAVVEQGTGGFTVKNGDLIVQTPLLTVSATANQSLAADGALKLKSTSVPQSSSVSPGMGASLRLTGGTTVDIISTAIKLPSGTLTIEATNGPLSISGGQLDVSGTRQQFFDVPNYTDGGSIILGSDAGLATDAGKVSISAGSSISVAAHDGGGSAGTLDISAPSGFSLDTNSKLLGKAPNGLGGSFNLDVQSLPSTSALQTTLNAGGFDRSVAIRVRTGDVNVELDNGDHSIHAHNYSLSADGGNIIVKANTTIDASGLDTGDTSKATGGTIDLAAAHNVTLESGSLLTAAGYCFDNAGKGGSISLSAGSYTYTLDPSTHQYIGAVDSTASVDIQSSGARPTIDLSVANQFTTEDMVLAGKTAPTSSALSGLPADGTGGTLHLRESQAAFALGDKFGNKNGAQFADYGNRIKGASAIVLEGFQVYDLSANDGTPLSTVGAITKNGSGGIIDSAVEQAIKSNGATFANSVSVNNPLFHVQPGAEIINNGTDTGTNKIVTLYTTGSSLSFSLGSKTSTTGTVTLPVPGGVFSGDQIALSGSGISFTVNFADGTSSSFPSGGLFTAPATDQSLVKSIALQNTTTSAKTGKLLFSVGSVPIAVVLPTASNGTTINPSASTKVTTITTAVGDLTLANTWDLSSYRFGSSTRQEPGVLTLRAKNNLVFAFDASLSDGFNTAINPVDPTNNPVDPKFPLWTAQLMSDRSWSYRLVAGADTTAADARQIRPLSTITDGSGSVLIGRGAVALPALGATKTTTIPQFYQTIRTGTGDIDLVAGRDVLLLNPLATVYTAGRAAASIDGFDVPQLGLDTVTAQEPYYTAQYSLAGGNVSISAQNDIARYQQFDNAGKPLAFTAQEASSKEMPTNWLYRRGYVGADGRFSTQAEFPVNDNAASEIQSTTWWVDFSNFFDDVGALGGGNVTLAAGNNVKNINASVPTNARMPGSADGIPLAPDASKLVELGGGNLSVRSGKDINGGVYYVERGDADLGAGGRVMTNSTRNALNATSPTTTNPATWLPTTLFLGKGRVDVSAGGDIQLGSVANAFWLLQGLYNRNYETTFFQTFDKTDTVSVSSVGGQVTLQVQPDTSSVSVPSSAASLAAWYSSIIKSSASAQPWLGFAGTNANTTYYSVLTTPASLLPGTLKVTAFTGDINVVGQLKMIPSSVGTIDLLAGGNISGLAVNGVGGGGQTIWGSAAINLSDANPAQLPSVVTPLTLANYKALKAVVSVFAPVDSLFAESGSTKLSLATKQNLHGLVRDANDTNPVHIYALDGDVSGVTLFSSKAARVVAGEDITDIALYIQNLHAGDVTLVAAGRDIVAYAPSSALRSLASENGSLMAFTPGVPDVANGAPTAGDIQIAGPGTLEVLAGRNLTLGSGANNPNNGTALGITSVGAVRNPHLLQNSGADIVAAAGIGDIYTSAASAAELAPGLATTQLGFSDFVTSFLTPNTENGDRYLPVLGATLGLATTTSNDDIRHAVDSLDESKDLALLDIFYLVLRDAGRDRNDPSSPNYRTYTNGLKAITTLFPDSRLPGSSADPFTFDLSLPTREIKTFEGGNIALLAPSGQVTVGRVTDPQTADEGILTEHGGSVSIFAQNSINVGNSRIFTLRGGDEVIWSSIGNIAAGNGSKTLKAAPPTRVLIDPQSADVQNDLAGLATGSGIGVLATLANVQPGNVDLIAPAGTIDAGDAGIRSSGKVTVSALTVVNAANIQSSAGTTGTPVAVVPNINGLTTASTASAGASSTAGEAARQQQRSAAQQQEDVLPSIIQVEVLGYGGGEGDETAKKKDEAGNG